MFDSPLGVGGELGGTEKVKPIDGFNQTASPCLLKQGEMMKQFRFVIRGKCFIDEPMGRKN
ncbi:MAG: hypothetical protein ACKER6_01240 [Candidatus Hodgkinia cicadicola]